LAVLQIAVKAGGRHRLFEERIIAKQSMIDREITVIGALRERQVSSAGPQIDALRPNQYERVPVSLQRVECVE